MNKVNLYLNPFYHPLAPTLAKAHYGWRALSHLTVEAVKIQNRSLRIISTVFAAIFDATIGLGILGTAFYNPSAFLYNNTYVRLKNRSIELQKTQANQKWNQTAIKTWVVIGGSLALVAGLYYFGAFGAEKRTPPPNVVNSTPLLTSESKESGSSWFSFFLGAGLLGALAFVGTKVFSRGKESNPKVAPFIWQFKDPIPSEIELANSRIAPTAGIPCCDGRIPFLVTLHDQCLAAFNEASGQVKIDPSKNFWRDNPSIVQAADALMRSAYALSRCCLEDLEAFAKLQNPPCSAKKVLLSQRSLHYKLFFSSSTSYLSIRRLENRRKHSPFMPDEDLTIGQRHIKGLKTEFGEEFIPPFYASGTLQNQWRELHNRYCQRVVDLLKPGQILEGLENVDDSAKYDNDGVLVADYRYLSWTKDFMDTKEHPLPTGGFSIPT